MPGAYTARELTCQFQSLDAEHSGKQRDCGDPYLLCQRNPSGYGAGTLLGTASEGRALRVTPTEEIAKYWRFCAGNSPNNSSWRPRNRKDNFGSDPALAISR